MSKSAAKKLRLKLEREGKRNPKQNRLSWYGINPVEKKTPTFQEQVRKAENKHKKRNLTQNGDDSFNFYIQLL